MKVMEAVDDCHVDGTDLHSHRNAIVTKPFLSVDCLYVGAFVCVCDGTCHGVRMSFYWTVMFMLCCSS